MVAVLRCNSVNKRTFHLHFAPKKTSNQKKLKKKLPETDGKYLFGRYSAFLFKNRLHFSRKRTIYLLEINIESLFIFGEM